MNGHEWVVQQACPEPVEVAYHERELFDTSSDKGHCYSRYRAVVAMALRISEVKYVSAYRIWLKFDDGIQGEVDLEDELWGGVFEPLKKKEFFKTVRLDRDLNTISWNNGADFSPEFLYERVKCPPSS